MHGYLRGYDLQKQTGSSSTFSIPSLSFRTNGTPNEFARNPQERTAVLEFPKDVNTRFGLRLRELRRSRNMTQLRMAVDFGIDRSFISDVERGRKSISLHMLEVIALGLQVSLSDLFDGI